MLKPSNSDGSKLPRFFRPLIPKTSEAFCGNHELKCNFRGQMTSSQTGVDMRSYKCQLKTILLQILLQVVKRQSLNWHETQPIA